MVIPPSLHNLDRTDAPLDQSASYQTLICERVRMLETCTVGLEDFVGLLFEVHGFRYGLLHPQSQIVLLRTNASVGISIPPGGNAVQRIDRRHVVRLDRLRHARGRRQIPDGRGSRTERDPLVLAGKHARPLDRYARRG